MDPYTRRLPVAAALACAALATSSVIAAEPQTRAVILATTTSTVDSGLLDTLLPVFELETGYFVKTIAAGSGQAIALGRRGEADVLLVHSPADEQKLVEDGHGVSRRRVMHNDFIILGPRGDPAGIGRSATCREALKKISESGALFVSRGDDSGTHAREKSLWTAAGVDPEGHRWYQQTGLGMGDTLNVAAEKGGYTLADRGTYLAREKARPLGLDVLVNGEPLLLNVYHVVEIDSARWPAVNASGAKALAEFLVSPQAQAIIGRFGVDTVGVPLFVPDAGKSAPLAGR